MWVDSEEEWFVLIWLMNIVRSIRGRLGVKWFFLVLIDFFLG